MMDYELMQELRVLLGERIYREKDEETWFYCPFHDDEHASMHINWRKGVWFCFVCQPTGYEATLRGIYEKLTGRKWKVHEAEEELVAVKTLDELLDFCHHRLLQSPLLGYLRAERALSDEVIVKAKLGLWQDRSGQNWLLIPIYDADGNVRRIKGRRLTSELTFSNEQPKYIFLKSTAHPLFPDDEVVYLYPLHLIRELQRDVVVIAGGELDALAAISAGYFAIAPTVGETSLLKKEIVEMLAHIISDRTVIIALDNEPQVQRNIPLIAQRLSNIAACVLFIPAEAYEDLKDVTDLARSGKLDEVLLQTVPYIPAGRPTNIVVFRKDDGYYYKKLQKGKWTQEEKFIDAIRFVPKYRFIHLEALQYPTEQGVDYLLCDIYTPTLVLTNKVIPVSVFGDASLRLRWLSQHSLSPYVFYHKNDAFVSLLSLLARNLPVKTVTHRIGLQKFNDQYFFIFPTITLPKPVVSWFGDPDPLFDVRPEEPTDLVSVADMISLLLKLHAPIVMCKLLAMTHAAALAPFVREKVFKFPVSLLFGYMGSGKTTLAMDVVLALLGAPRTIRLAVTQTESTVRKYADIFVSIPLIFDEFTPDRHDPSLLQNVKIFVHACYDATVKQVSRSATEFERPQYAYAPLWIIGENNNWVMAEGALRERIYQIPIPRPPKPEEIAAYQKYLQFIHSSVHRQYAYCYYDWLLKHQNDWDMWWNDAQNLALRYSSLITVAVTERILIMFTVVLFGWLLFSRFVKEVFDYDVSSEIADEEVVRHLAPFFGQSYITNRIERLIVQLDDLIETDDAIKGEHYEISENGLLYIQLNKTLKLLNTRYRRLWEHVDKSTILADARNMIRDVTNNFIKEVEKHTRVNGKDDRWMIVDIYLFEQITGYRLEAVKMKLRHVTTKQDESLGDIIKLL
jgi:Zn-finger protein